MTATAGARRRADSTEADGAPTPAPDDGAESTLPGASGSGGLNGTMAPPPTGALEVEPDEEDELELLDFEYRPTPPKRSFTMTVHLHVRGRGKPVPYEPPDDPGT
jgi:hypothetical protein